MAALRVWRVHLSGSLQDSAINKVLNTGINFARIWKKIKSEKIQRPYLVNEI